MQFEQTWRWFGIYDPIPLSDIKQTGAIGMVTSLHHIPRGEVWPVEAILNRKNAIEKEGLTWSVIESIPPHEDIRKRTGKYKLYIDNFKHSIRNLARCGISTVCYDFMPVLDWTRTHVNYRQPDGSTALRFDNTALAAFDLFMLERPEAGLNYSSLQKERAKKYFDSLTDDGRQTLINNILSGLPGEEEMTMDKFRTLIGEYKNIGEEKLRSNLYQFLEEVVPFAEGVGARLAIHPDDPPFSLFGLPRIVSTETDLQALLQVVDSPANGLTFCTGSLGARADNDLPGMIERLGVYIHFVHLRSVKRKGNGSFYEANHLEGDANMFKVMLAIIKMQRRRKQAGRDHTAIPLRSDHGNRMLDDLKKSFTPAIQVLVDFRALPNYGVLRWEYGK